MNVDLFIRSYYKDFRWLTYSLRSIARYARGFRRTLLVIPQRSATRLNLDSLVGDIELQLCEDFDDDYLGQQVTKLYADSYTDADLICHLDADCLFVRETHPEHLLQEGKVLVPITPYCLFPKERAWQSLSEEFMGHPVQYDFMRRQPFLFPRWLYAECRKHAETLHKQPLRTHVLTRRPRGFSEYNVLGALAYYRFHSAFAWQERSVWSPDESVCRWFWSWDGISEAARQEMEGILS